MAGYIGSKGSGIISGIDASIADLNLTDKASANGTTEANKVLTADGNKDVTAIRNLTATGTVTRALTRGSIDVGNSSGVSTPLAIGGANTLLQSDGTDASWATVSGSDSRQSFVADGTIGARAGVFLTADGKVSTSPSYLISDYNEISDLGTVRTNTYSPNYSGASGCTAFSTQDNKIVSVMKSKVYSTAVNAQYMVSTLAADGTLSHGSLIDFNTSSFPFINAINMKYNAAINRFICWGGNGYGAGTSGVATTQQFIAIGTLNASNNTVAWTFTNVTIVGYYSSSGSSIPYSSRSNSFNYCAFDVATDGSHMAAMAIGYYDNAGSQSRTVMRAFSINASNNTASGGSWTPLKQAGNNVIGNYGGAFNVTWHNGTSQYIIQGYGGNVYGINTSTYAAYNNTTVFWLATVSGNTISQVTTSSILRTDADSGGANASYNKDIVWVATDDANVLWGISGYMSYNQGIALHRITIGSGSLSSYSRSSLIQLQDSQGNNINTIGDGEASVNAVNPLPVGGGTSSPRWLLNFLNYNIYTTGILSTNKWSAEIAYDSSTLGSLTFSEGNEVTNQQFDPVGATQYYPSGGNCWAYDSNRNQAVGIGTTTMSSDTSTQKYITAVATRSASGNKGSLNNAVGLNDSSSSVSDGNAVTTAMLGSVVSGFSGLGIGSSLKTSGSTVGIAISATKVFVTANGNGGG